jgi:alkylhydroperoxidase/carboxymuconolactone decarboxylase family protein YurZ
MKTNNNLKETSHQESGMPRRRFMTSAGALLGVVAAGELATACAQTRPEKKGSDETKPIQGQTGIRPVKNHGPWEDSLEKLSEWDPEWATACEEMTLNPWNGNVLPKKTIELISVALNVAYTNLNPEGTRRHIRGALDAGATREEIMLVLKMASLLPIHSCSLGAPILLEEAKEAGVKPAGYQEKPETPFSDKMKAAGQWNTAWDPFFEIDPLWTDQFMAAGGVIYSTSQALPLKEIELLSIAFDASVTHMYAPGTRRHIKAALKLGATMEEIMEVLKLCVVQGVQACNLGIPILTEELANRQAK